jgi:signal transduction histidine kinase
MKEISDDVLVDELQKRLEDNRKALHDLRVMTRKLETLNVKLAESEALKGDFLSNIRNEINNPMTSIMGLAKQIAGNDVDPETARRMARMIHNEAFDLDFQLRNIFSAAELEAGEATLCVSKIDVELLVRDLIESFSHRALEKRLTMNIVWDIPQEAGAPFYFKTDAEKLDRILSNLLANAIEFNKEGKSVTITITQKNNHLTISVEDDGIGISCEQRASLFARFKQLDSGARRSHRGHGLGLSITKALVELLEGTVAFTSDDSGCLFTVSINEAESGAWADTLSEEGNEFIF